MSDRISRFSIDSCITSISNAYDEAQRLEDGPSCDAIDYAWEVVRFLLVDSWPGICDALKGQQDLNFLHGYLVASLKALEFSGDENLILLMLQDLGEDVDAFELVGMADCDAQLLKELREKLVKRHALKRQKQAAAMSGGR